MIFSNMLSAILKESELKPDTAIGGVKMSETIVYKPLSKLIGMFIIGTCLSLLLGYYLPSMLLSVVQSDWSFFLLIFLGLPAGIAVLSYYAGWNQKKQTIEYHPPKWDLAPFQMTIDDAKRLPREYNRKYVRLVADSNFWTFFTPILLIIISPAIPLYSFYEDPKVIDLIPLLNACILVLVFMVAITGAFRATSNSASADFTLPLIREAVKLAELQTKATGACHVRVVTDVAKEGDFKVYGNPRVVLRIEGLEKEAYIESWSEDLGALTRVLCCLYEKDNHPQVVWWWFSTDRNFRKFVHPDENGYYVEHPIGKHGLLPGVKDVVSVTQIAIALVLREYLQTRGESEKLRGLLASLGAENN
jgi:hypothetical protein